MVKGLWDYIQTDPYSIVGNEHNLTYSPRVNLTPKAKKCHPHLLQDSIMILYVLPYYYGLLLQCLLSPYFGVQEVIA